jgi:hypothetical protein
MRQRTVAALVVAALTALPAVASAKVNVGDTAPEIKAASWYNLPEGVKSLSLKDLKGQVVMIEFWATW